MKKKDRKKPDYVLIIALALLLIIPVILLFKDFKVKHSYETVKQSKNGETIFYAREDFLKNYKKIGFEEAKCNDKEVVGMDNIICKASRKLEAKEDFIELAYNDSIVETLTLKLNYDEVDTQKVKKDIDSIVNNFLVFNLRDKALVELKDQLKMKNTVHGATLNNDVGNYKIYLNLKTTENEEEEVKENLITFKMYLKETVHVEQN